MKLDKLDCCLAHPMNAIRTLFNKINDVIEKHNALVSKVDTIDYGDGSGKGEKIPNTGEPHMHLVTDSEGGFKWEPRTHFDRVSDSFKNFTYNTETVEGMENIFMFTPAEPYNGQDLILGETYLVTFISESKGLVVVGDMECRQYAGSLYFGNVALSGDEEINEGDNTGEDFVVFLSNPGICIHNGGKYPSDIIRIGIQGRLIESIHMPAKFMPCLISPSGYKFVLGVTDEGEIRVWQTTDTRYS